MDTAYEIRLAVAAEIEQLNPVMIASGDLSEELRSILDDERQQGMTNRVAMMYDNIGSRNG